jgi:hypothetical protein
VVEVGARPRRSSEGIRRNCAALSRIASAMRIFSGQESLARDRCHSAWASSNACSSECIEESPHELLPTLTQTTRNPE